MKSICNMFTLHTDENRRTPSRLLRGGIAAEKYIGCDPFKPWAYSSKS